jgi:hypothetical protein
VGSIDKRRGKFVARWRDADGDQHSRAFDRERDARRHLTDVQSQLDRGVYVDPRRGQITLSEYAAGWLAGLTSDPVTQQRVRQMWRLHIEPSLGDVPLAQLRTSRIQQWTAGLQRDLGAAYTGHIVDAVVGAEGGGG